MTNEAERYTQMLLDAAERRPTMSAADFDAFTWSDVFAGYSAEAAKAKSRYFAKSRPQLKISVSVASDASASAGNASPSA